MLSFEDARRKIIAITKNLPCTPAVERIGIESALGRILAENITADRDYPPFDRAARDGYAVRSADCREPGATLRIIGEVRAGSAPVKAVGSGECMQIMTGAAVPAGADAVVMIEQTRPGGSSNEIVIERNAQAGMNFVPRGAEARAGDVLLRSGKRLGDAELSLAAQVGCAELAVYCQPRVAILSTGDEVVAIEAKPGLFEIRNSNSVSLAAQCRAAGGEPVLLGNAPDRANELRKLIERGLAEDILVMSGGVSMGKYDLVEGVLRELGAEFFFDAVDIRPGRPAVFGVCRGKPVFGLPGNPVSTMVTFELFVVPSIDILGGSEPRPLPLLKARLAKPVEKKADLTHFVPALLEWSQGEATVTELAWQGSGDIGTVARGNCYLVVPQAKLKLAAGEWVDVLPRRGLL
ncbi:MAG TPA: gephyrin-like molybdotransferase Glp [Candidatus Acidoferrales bacterium]|nr:gephyrin-like molybdotransferase Glp [Candidatus Acidoferrales bacterium]